MESQGSILGSKGGHRRVGGIASPVLEPNWRYVCMYVCINSFNFLLAAFKMNCFQHTKIQVVRLMSSSTQWNKYMNEMQCCWLCWPISATAYPTILLQRETVNEKATGGLQHANWQWEKKQLPRPWIEQIAYHAQMVEYYYFVTMIMWQCIFVELS